MQFPPTRIVPIARIAVALQPARGGIIVLRRAQEMQQAVGPSHRDSARIAGDQQIGPRCRQRQHDAGQHRRKAPPAPASPPDRQPQSAQRHQHQRRTRKGRRRRSPRPADPKPSVPPPASRRCPAHQMQRRSSSPNGIAATLKRRRRHHHEAHHRHGQEIAQHRVMRGAVEMNIAKGMVARLPTRLVMAMPRR